MAQFRRAVFRRADLSSIIAVDSSFSATKFNRADFSGAIFALGDWTDAAFQHASMDKTRWLGAKFAGSILHLIGKGVRIEIGQQYATLLGRNLTVGRAQHSVREWLHEAEALCRRELYEDDQRYPQAIRRAIRAIIALNKARRLSYREVTV
jgi:uncharacterized protein YjbI with pentapeptide repeats